MATATQTGATAVPARTTDLRERKIAPMLTSTGAAGGMVPSTPTMAPTAPGGPDFGIGTQTITPENTLRNQRLNFEVQNRDVAAPGGFERVKSRKTVGSVRAAFDANLPQLMQQFKDESRALAMRTSALGRTGSGLFNRDTGYVGDRALQARDALLGNLAFQATQADANRALQAAMGNQAAGLQSNSLASQIAAANASRALQVDMARQSHFAAQQAREDQMAREVLQNQQIQAMLLGQGFQNQPTGAIGQAANAYLAGAGNYGANAGQINDQTSTALNQAVQSLPRPSTSTGPTVIPQRPGPSVPTWALPKIEKIPTNFDLNEILTRGE